ncbi:hypothetical protein [Streptomyces sp. SLBN-8D4]|uniref:hypothetical protein n=1 Tax=Streptomyces sp. SLBN-8D4 TaxID=3377728 RepID=UPI003C7DFBA2
MEEQLTAPMLGRLTGFAATVVQVRGAVALEREKRRTMTQLADCLTHSGQISRVTHRDPSGGEWTIALGPVIDGTGRW